MNGKKSFSMAIKRTKKNKTTTTTSDVYSYKTLKKNDTCDCSVRQRKWIRIFDVQFKIRKTSQDVMIFYLTRLQHTVQQLLLLLLEISKLLARAHTHTRFLTLNYWTRAVKICAQVYSTRVAGAGAGARRQKCKHFTLSCSLEAFKDWQKCIVSVHYSRDSLFGLAPPSINTSVAQTNKQKLIPRLHCSVMLYCVYVRSRFICHPKYNVTDSANAIAFSVSRDSLFIFCFFFFIFVLCLLKFLFFRFSKWHVKIFRMSSYVSCFINELNILE